MLQDDKLCFRHPNDSDTRRFLAKALAAHRALLSFYSTFCPCKLFLYTSRPLLTLPCP